MLGLWLSIALAQPTEWTVETSPSGSQVEVRRAATAPVTGAGGVQSLAELVVHCDRKRLTVFIRTPGLSPEVHADLYDDFLARTRQKLGNEPAEDVLMRKDIADETMHYRRAKPAVRALQAHDVLLFAFQPFGADPVDMRFELAGLTEALSAFDGVCRL